MGRTGDVDGVKARQRRLAITSCEQARVVIERIIAIRRENATGNDPNRLANASEQQ